MQGLSHAALSDAQQLAQSPFPSKSSPHFIGVPARCLLPDPCLLEVPARYLLEYLLVTLLKDPLSLSRDYLFPIHSRP